ncbi:hypothetical protein [Lysinibacter cavernae]|uniref:SipW-cognate class signal peptide n=1 Tax=Lysinibacter cavernae TaxID=1640652 RepID=A0A7X5R197_9MICO|nr:hypothetical protein [Lysinibacter cavernae]NIH53850.1 hypothetical protein [Lysinibacter cavernae]
MGTTRRKSVGRKRLVLALGAAVALTVLVTSAAFSDFANLNLGAKDKGIAAGKFNIQVGSISVPPGATEGGVDTKACSAGQEFVDWIEADQKVGVDLYQYYNKFEPGGPDQEVYLCFRVDPASDFKGNVKATIQDIDGKATHPDLKSVVQYKIDYADPSNVGTYYTNMNWQTKLPFTTQSAMTIVNLDTVESGEMGFVRVFIRFPDQGANNNSFQTKQAFPQLVFYGESVEN